MTDNYITLQETASLLGVTTATLRNWDKSGKLKAVRHPINNYRMYRMVDVSTLQNQMPLFRPESEETPAEQRPIHGTSLTSAGLRRLVKGLHRTLRDGEGNSSLIERFDELTKVLYLKVHDERGRDTGGDGPFVIRPVASDRAIAERVRSAFQEHVQKNLSLFPQRFRRLKLADATIRRIVEPLAVVQISGAGDDLKGIAYEEVIKNTFDKGDNQQFFTPRTVVEFIVEFIGDILSGRVCDPACGTGGFMLSVDSYLGRSAKRPRCELVGFEVDERLAWVAGINLDMHNVNSFKIECINGSGSLGSEVAPNFGTVDAIVTNPPFGSDLTDEEALTAFELGRGRQSRRRGVLFIERCIELLKPGGVVAIIIDEGVLNSPSNADTRRLILGRSDPFAIVSLPETAFMPYASVKTSILFLQKRGGRKPRLRKGDRTFFAEVEAVGRKPSGDPVFRVNKATGRQELDSDLPDILARWRAGNEGVTAGVAHDGGTFWAELPPLADEAFERDGYRLDLAYHHPARHEASNALHSSRYPLKALHEICSLRNEAVVPSKDLQDEDITYVGLANIEADSGLCSPTTVSGSTLKSAVKRFIAGDILYAKMRPGLRKICLIPEDIDEGFASSECLVLVPKVHKDTGAPVMDPKLLSHLLRSGLAYGQVVHQVIGIGRPRVSSSVVQNIRIPVPPAEDQRRLLQLYQRSEAAAQALIAEGQKAIKKAHELVGTARRQLVEDLLRNGGSERAR